MFTRANAKHISIAGLSLAALALSGAACTKREAPATTLPIPRRWSRAAPSW